MLSPDPELELKENPDPWGHSLSQLRLIRGLRLKRSLSLSSALYLATQMVIHGFPEAISLIADLRATTQRPAIQEYLTRLDARFRVIEALTWRRAIFRDSALMTRLYQTDGATFIPHPTDRRDLIVVFLTAFNNFGISNPVLLAVLWQCNFSVLLLRDCSKYRYLRGVKGCGNTLDSVADYIGQVQKTGEFERLFITGYSSGGYASLFMSTLVKTYTYIGFAIESDFSLGGPPAPKSRKSINLWGEVDGKYLLSLRDLVAASVLSGGRKLFFGDRSDFDRAQSACFMDLAGCSIEAVADSGHEVTLDLLERGRLLEIFQTVRTRA